MMINPKCILFFGMEEDRGEQQAVNDKNNHVCHMDTWTTCAIPWISGLKPRACCLRMLLKIVRRFADVGAWTSNTRNREARRGSIGFLAPPGGPMAARVNTSFTVFQLSSFPLS